MKAFDLKLYEEKLWSFLAEISTQTGGRVLRGGRVYAKRTIHNKMDDKEEHINVIKDIRSNSKRPDV